MDYHVYPTGAAMKLIVSKWGNSLAVRIPVDLARAVALEVGSEVDCSMTPAGTLELVPGGAKVRAQWLQNHFLRVNQRLTGQSITTPAWQLLREEERY